MPNVLLGATGSVAAVRIPVLSRSLISKGYHVKVVATDASLYFFDSGTLEVPLIRDADEWPGRSNGKHYERDDPIMHIELREWADLFVIAPLDANTLAKLAVGLCDNCLTSIWRAWDPSRPVVLAPAMNTLMWENAFTRRHLRSIGADFGASHVPGHLEALPLIAQINDRAKLLKIVPPIEKILACGDVGVGGLAEVDEIAKAVAEMFLRTAAPISTQVQK